MNASRSKDHTWALSLLSKRFRPRKRLSVSAWSDAYRVLSGKASAEAGQWRSARTPYLREIMDCLSDDSPVQRVVFMKPAQVGATECANNWIGYVMGHVRTSKPMLVVLPSDDLRKRWVHQRLRPMVSLASPLRGLIDVSKSRDGTNTLDLIDYPGGLLYLTSAGSPSRLKSDSIRFVVCDECDEFGWDVGGKGDPMGLIESRTANFPRRKLFLLSTPTNKGASRIEGEWDRSDQRRFHVPCPHCGEPQLFEWSHLQWTEDLARVWYVCRHNGCMIDERDKPDMLEAGSWVAEHPDRAVRGYHLNALYTPLGLGFGWRELVNQWMYAQQEPERLKQFTNERLGLAYEDPRTAIKAGGLRERAEPYPLRQPPDGCLLLTAGVDTQDNRLAVHIVGWGPGASTKLQWWALDYIEIPGSPARDDTWLALAEFLNEPLTNLHGREIRISATAIDMGGHFTEEVKAFVRGARAGHVHHKVIAIVGSNTKQNSIIETRPRKTDFNWRGQFSRRGMEYWRVGTEKAKDYLYRCLREDEDKTDEERQGHFSHGLEHDYYRQLISEVWDPKKNKYVEKRGHRAFEVLDTWVYATAAAYYPRVRVREVTKRKWAELALLYGPADAGDARAGVQPPPPATKHPGKPGGATVINQGRGGLIR